MTKLGSRQVGSQWEVFRRGDFGTTGFAWFVSESLALQYIQLIDRESLPEAKKKAEEEAAIAKEAIEVIKRPNHCPSCDEPWTEWEQGLYFGATCLKFNCGKCGKLWSIEFKQRNARSS